MKQGKTDMPNKMPMVANGTGVNKRDPAKAPMSSKPSGGATKVIRKNVVNRTSGSLKGYK